MKGNADGSDRRTSRRTFLGLVGLAAGAGATTSASALPTWQSSAETTGGFTIRQGDQCIPVEPLSYESDTVADFYAYSTEDYESHTKTGLEASDVSQLFLYEDPDGRISLAIIHDVAEGSEGTGGAASFSFSGLSADGEWLVRNDDYSGANEIWDVSSSHESDAVHWSWNKWHSDGGVFGGLGDGFEVTIDPAFNGSARLDPETAGEITEWQFVSGDPANPDRISLDMSEPLTIQAGACGTDVAEKVTAELDVKPGEGAVVNPRSRGRLPVALLSSETFDATTVDPGTITFGPGDAAPVHLVETDVNGDGRADLLMHFEMPATGIVVNTTTVTLNAETTEGTRVYASDDLDIVANRDDDEEEREHTNHEETEEDDSETTETTEDARERAEDTTNEARERAEETREEAEEKAEKEREKAEKEREKAEEKREKRDEKREKRESDDEEGDRGRGHGHGRGRGENEGGDDDDDDDGSDDGGDDDSLIGIGALLG